MQDRRTHDGEDADETQGPEGAWIVLILHHRPFDHAQDAHVREGERHNRKQDAHHWE